MALKQPFKIEKLCICAAYAHALKLVKEKKTQQLDVGNSKY